MKTEAYLFTGIAVFFAVTGAGYAWRSRDPTGTAVLIIAFLMAALVAFFLHVQYRRRGVRPQDRKDAEVVDSTGPLEFMPPGSPWPIVTAAGFAVVCLGVVVGLWLLLLGLGLLAQGVFGMVFQYASRDAAQGSTSRPPEGRSGISTRSR